MEIYLDDENKKKGEHKADELSLRKHSTKNFQKHLTMSLTLSYRGGGRGKKRPLLFFLHHPKTAQGIKLKLSDFKDNPLRRLLQVKPVCYILGCCHSNKITKGTSQNFAPKKSEKSAIFKDIELKFGIETTFVPLSSKSNINPQFKVIMTSL